MSEVTASSAGCPGTVPIPSFLDPKSDMPKNLIKNRNAKKAFSLKDSNARLTLNVGDKSLLFQGGTIPKYHLGVKEKETTI